VRDLNKIQSEAYRQVEEVRGAADAKATEIYARAYNQSPEAVAFYEFTRTMQSYKSTSRRSDRFFLSPEFCCSQVSSAFIAPGQVKRQIKPEGEDQ
jgi:modulator of FtsH protease HflC